MKLGLVVLSEGKAHGKTIPINLSQFLIGRDPQCHLRPASPLISKRHCAILIRDGKALIRDFASTNGTMVNGVPIDGEKVLEDGDELKIGPLLFRVEIERTAPVNKPTPLPANATAATQDDDEIAALLLGSVGNIDETSAGTITENDIPQGTTELEVPKLEDEGDEVAESSNKDDRLEKIKKEQANTQVAAAEILQRYARRQRS